MANVRCPMCSKINPPEAETCSHCGARLKSVRPKPDQSPVPDAGDSQDQDPGEDWLSSLRLGNSEEAPAPGEDSLPEIEDGETPDWLSRVRERARLEQSDPDAAPESEDAEPDWMNDLRGDIDQPKLGATGELLSRLPGSEQEPQIDDWLKSFPEQTPSSTSDQESFGTLFPPDQPSTPDSQDAEGEEEWMNKLSAWQNENASDSQEIESPPDWMNADLQTSGSQEGEKDVLDWPAIGEPETGDKPEEDGLSDWMRDAPSDSAADDLPQWLGGSPEEDSEPLANAEIEKPTASDQEAELPDWFSTFGSADAMENQASEQLPAAEEPVVEENEVGDLPDWLAEQPDQPEALPAQESEQPQDDLAWLSAANEVEEGEPAQTESAAEEPPAELPSAETFDAEESPEWLRDFSAQASTEDDFVVPLLDADDQAAIPSAEEMDSTFSAQELPDWLSDETSTPEAAPVEEKTSEPAGEELARAELPEWVKEMRPIESVIPGETAGMESSQQVEKAGPLAGLRGVLPAEEHVIRYRKPPVYSAKLRVTEKQRNQSSLLDSIINQESQPLLIAPERSRAPRMLARIIVALLFIGVVSGLRLFPLGIAIAPVLKPPELLNMFTQIEGSTSQNAPVLLAMDFEPGRAGEMFFASSPVIEHLMAKNAQIVVLSTVPTGPALAQRLLQDTAADLKETTSQAYDLGTQTINLGYLPGGTISLLEFAHQPSRAAPATLEGNFDIWGMSILKNVHDLSGFSQVIVLTDSAETGRAWVEQVRPLMGQTPLFMVTSAQAAPLLMPYIQSEQVDGMVDGLLGGVLYGQLRNAETPAGVYWESYQVVIVIAILLMLIGGGFSGLVALTRRKGKEGA